MKSASPFLFELIKSLTNSEKRYFSIFAGRHYPDQNNSLTLFKTLDSQVQYNENEAIRITGWDKNNFAVQKNILYDQILTALVQYDASGSIVQKLQQDILACQRLLQKGLISQAKVRLKKTKTTAAIYQMHEIGTQALLIESMIQAREQYKQTTDKELELWYEETSSLSRKMETEAYFKYINSRAQKIQISAGGKSTGHTAAVKALLDEMHSRGIDENVTDRALMDMLQTEALYYFMAQDTVRAQQTNANYIALMESHDHWIKFYPQRYFSALNNYLIDCFQLKKEEELKAALDKMRSLKVHPAFKKIANLESNIFRITYQVELNYLISGGQFAQASDMIPIVTEGLNKYADVLPVNHKMNMQYLCAYGYFGTGRYKDASGQLDILQQYPRSDAAAILDNVVSLMQVVCHYEIGNYSILEGLVKSCKRKLRAQKGAIDPDAEFDLLNAILTFSANKPAPKDWKKLWNKLTDGMDKRRVPTAYSAYFDFFNYIRAKGLGLSFEKAWEKENISHL